MRSILRPALGALLLLMVAGCAEADGASPSGARPAVSVPTTSEEEVVIDDASFSVAELTVGVGTTVTWRNEDDVGHTVTHGEDGDPALDARFDEEVSVDQVVSYTFEEAGTYPVTCRIHPEMQMTVTVDEG